MEIPTSELNKMTVEEFDTTKLLLNAARQRDKRNLQDYLIVDTDCHHYENESMRDIVEYIDDPVMRQTGRLYAGMGTGAIGPAKARDDRPASSRRSPRRQPGG